jgi:uncharacterized protein YciI
VTHTSTSSNCMNAFRGRSVVALFLLALICAIPSQGQNERPMPPTQFVVVHEPGRLWRPHVSAFDQPGIQGHVDHYRRLFLEGKLLMGGPFLDDKGGGMMIVAPGVDRVELAAFAADDPTVKSGLLTFTVRPWLVGMNAITQSGPPSKPPKPAE